MRRRRSHIVLRNRFDARRRREDAANYWGRLLRRDFRRHLDTLHAIKYFRRIKERTST